MQMMELEEEIMDAQVEGPREKLRQILEKNGESLLQDSDRVEGLLRDHCGSYRKEISALVGALNERIPLELKGSWQTAMTPEAMRARLVQRMEDHRGLAPEVAEWAVDTWSYALGIGLGRRSDRLPAAALGSSSKFNTGPSGDFNGGTGAAVTDAERQAAIASDRPGGVKATAGAGLLASPDQKKKVGIGVAAVVLVAAAAAIGINMHKRPVVPTPPIERVDPAPTPKPSPDPNANTKPDSTSNPESSSSPASVGTAIAAGTPIQIRLNQGINSDKVNIGQTFSATLAAPLILNGKTVLPMGADATVKVVSVDQGKRFTGQTQMQLALVNLASNGKTYKLSVAPFSVLGPRQAVVAATHTGVGAAVGAVGGFIGGKIFHHGKAGTLVGAGAGAGVGAATTKPQPAKVQPEQLLHFRLMKPLSAAA